MTITHTTGRLGKGALALVLAGTMALSGCDEQIVLTDAAVTADDSCSRYRATIAQARQTDIQQQAAGAAAGALIGAVLGAAIAGSQGQDRTRGALIGAGLGGLTGLSATYYQQLRERAADQATLLATVNSDARRELGLITQTGQATQALRSCRQQQVANLAARVRSGATTAEAGRAELAQLRARLSADNQVVSASFNGIGQRVDAYVDATSQATQVQSAIIRAERPPAPQAAQRVRASVPNVTRAATQSTAIVAQDQQSVARIEQEIDALEVLLG